MNIKSLNKYISSIFGRKPTTEEVEKMVSKVKTVEGRNLLRSRLSKQPLLSGPQIRDIRIAASRSDMPTLRRYRMWKKGQP